MVNYKQTFLANTALHSTLPIFYQPSWLNVVCGNNWQVVASHLINGDVAAIFIFLVDVKYGIKLLRTPILTPYSGLYILPTLHTSSELQRYQDIHIQALLVQLPKCAYFEFCTFPTFQNFAAFTYLGYNNMARVTYWIDLTQTYEQLLKQVQPRKMRYINNALDYRFCTALIYLDQFLPCHKNTFTSKGNKYPYMSSFLKSFITSAVTQGWGTFYTLIDAHQKAVAFLFVVHGAGVTTQLLSCYIPGASSNQCITIITWHAILKSFQQNNHTYDFEGSDMPKIAKFFGHFGGQQKTYYNFTKTPSTLWRLKQALLPHS